VIRAFAPSDCRAICASQSAACSSAGDAEQIEAHLVHEQGKGCARPFFPRLRHDLAVSGLPPARLDPPAAIAQVDVTGHHVGGPERAGEVARQDCQRRILEAQVAPPQHRVELLEGEEVVAVGLHHHVENGLGGGDAGPGRRVALR
jgi:hypothetical protein